MMDSIIFYPDYFNYIDEVTTLSEEWLWREYWDKVKPTIEVAYISNTTSEYISKLLAYYSIPARKQRGAHLSWINARRLSWYRERGGPYASSGKATWIEKALYDELERLGIEYMKQYSPQGYSRIYDALVLPNIFVETHGDYWHSSLEQQYVDELKEAWANDNGCIYVAIWEHEIKEVGIERLVEERILPLLIGGSNEEAA